MNIIKTHLDHGKRFNDPKIIVIHAMGEFIGGSGWKNHAVQYLDKIGLSAHGVGDPNGTIYECRLDGETAYHALGYNEDTLGYEFLVEGEHNYSTFLKAIDIPYLTTAQYDAGVEWAIEKINMYDIEKVVRHSDLSPERKVDPGRGFPWERFLSDIGKG